MIRIINYCSVLFCCCCRFFFIEILKKKKIFFFFFFFFFKKNTKAPQAAGKIHTDFEKGFIMAEVMAYNDFKEHESEAACKVSCNLMFLI